MGAILVASLAAPITAQAGRDESGSLMLRDDNFNTEIQRAIDEDSKFPHIMYRMPPLSACGLTR